MPVHQVKEFSPDLSFGGSASSAGLVALALSDEWERFGPAIVDWEHLAVYYAAITSEGRGRVQAIPGLRDPLVTYRLTSRDKALLGRGLARLALLMLESGATEVYPSYRGAPIVRRPSDLATLQGTFGVSKAAVMTVHLCSTVPFGEDRRAATDSFGRRARDHQRPGQRRLAAPGRAGRQPSGVGDGRRHPQRPALHRDGQAVTAGPQERIAPPDVTVVTGAAGWLGRALVDHLSRPDGPFSRPGTVRALVAIPRTSPSSSSAAGSSRSWATSRRPDGLTALFDGLREAGTVDVIHTAGVIHPARMDDFEEINVRGTANVMAAAAAHGARRVVHVSSNSPFGTNPHPGDTFRNDEPYDPYYGYGRSKMQAELRVKEAVAGASNAVIVRPPWFYGPFQPARQTTFFRMVRTGRFPVFGDGAAAAIDGVRRQPRPGRRGRRAGARRRPAAAGGSPTPGPTP